MRSLVRYIAVTAVTAGFVWAIVFFGERPLLNQVVVPRPGTRLPFYIADFMSAAAFGVWASAAGSFFWFLFARWISGVVDWRSSGKRSIWAVLGVLTVAVCTVYGFYYVPIAESGGAIAYTLFLVNSSLIYYMSTTLASPPSYKYTPYGARTLRIF